MFVPFFGVASRRISMPVTCSNGRKYINGAIGRIRDEPWTTDIVH